MELQLCTDQFVCLVILNERGTILSTAPILRKFEGQNLRNLIHWIQHSFKSAKLISLIDGSIMYEKLS